MNFAELLALVITKLRHDGASTYAYSGTTTELEAEIAYGLNDYVLETRMLWGDRVSLGTTITTGSNLVSFLPVKVAVVKRVWIGGTEIAYVGDGLQYINNQSSTLSISDGTPKYWTNDTRDGHVQFDCPIQASVATLTTHAASGFMIHPAISGTSTAISVPVSQRHELAEFIVSNVIKPVAADQVTAARLQSYMDNAALQMERHRARNLKRYSC